MSDDEWGLVPGTWNMFENSHGWQLTLDIERMPTRWPLRRRRDYAAALICALNRGMPPMPGNHKPKAAPDSEQEK